VAFTQSLRCYQQVLAYDQVGRLDPDVATAYLDLAGSGDLRRRVRKHLGDRLVHEAIIGVTSQELAGAQALSGPRTSVFFAPDQMRKRTADWGRAGLDERFTDAWRRFAPAVEGWVDVDVQHGPEALREAWLEVLTGRTAPRVGHVLTL
jgi:hypothetical protein